MAVSSTQPYLIRALYEWCADNGCTPYITVALNEKTRVPAAYVTEAQITLNISAEATQHLAIENDAIHFAARFGGVPMNVYVPIEQVLAIYARENGVGMAFPAVGAGEDANDAVAEPVPEAGARSDSDESAPIPAADESSGSTRSRPTLKRIK